MLHSDDHCKSDYSLLDSDDSKADISPNSHSRGWMHSVRRWKKPLSFRDVDQILRPSGLRDPDLRLSDDTTASSSGTAEMGNLVFDYENFDHG